MNPIKRAILLFALTTPWFALAQDTTWTGNSNEFWGISGNWTGGVPNAGEGVLFDDSASGFVVDLGADNRFAGLIVIEAATSYSFEDTNPGQTLSLDDLIATDGDHTFSADLVLTDPSTSEWSVKSGSSVHVSGNISGSSGLDKEGPGSLTFSGSNTYIGGTTISGGTLQIGNGGTTGSVLADITNNGSLIFNRSNTSAFLGTISGTGSVTQSGSGTLVLTGANTYTGVTTISSGSLQIGAGGTGSAVSGNIINNTNLVYNNSGSSTYSGAISGIGSVTKSGSSSVIYTGTNTYSGGTTITAGSLQLGDGGTTGSIPGNVTNNASLIFNRSDSQTFSGVISGSGSVTQAGSGSVTLTNANTYSGGTTVSAGTLQLGNGGTTGTIVGNITNDGNVTFNRSDSPTFSAVISGTGSVTQGGSGSLTLTNANTYSGGTTVSAGTLLLGNGGTTGAIVGDITNNASVIFNRSDNLTFAGDISGAGSVTKSGNGALVLKGANTFSGGTTISAGSLQIGDGGTTGSISGNISNSTHLIFNRSDSSTFSGAVSGTGNITKLGSGNLIVSGTNTYSGSTTVSAGSLQIGDGGTTGSVPGNITNNASLVFNRSDNPTFSGVISGTGSVTQSGSGNLTFSGANTYSGSTTIGSGQLVIAESNVDALANSAVTVSSGAQLTIPDTVGDTYTLGSLAGAGNVDFGSGDLRVGDDNSSTAFSGALISDLLNGGGKVDKRGTGIWTLTGSGHNLEDLEAYDGGQVIIDGASGAIRVLRIWGATTQGLIQNTTDALQFEGIFTNGQLTISGAATTVALPTGILTAGTDAFLIVENGASLHTDGFFQQLADANTVVDQATMSFAEFSSVGALGTISITNPVGGTALTMGADGADASTFTGNLQDHENGPGSVSKVGANSITLDGNNFYTGLTTIEAGTLVTDNLTGNVLTTSGTFSPGPETTTTTLGGSYTQQAGGTLLLEIGGTTAGTDYDVLSLAAASDLDGTIEVQLTNSFAPADGDQFTLITTTQTITDSGVSFVLPDIGPSLEWQTALGTNSLVLSVQVNDPPVADVQAVSVNEDSMVTLVLTGSDSGGQPLTFSIKSDPADGTLGPLMSISDTSAEVTYTPNPDFDGSDSVTFSVNDGTFDSLTAATVNLTVDPINDQPGFTAIDPATVSEDSGTQTLSNWASFDPGPDAEAGQSVLTYLVSNVSNTALFAVGPSIATNGTLTYTPADDASGTATFDIAVQDDGGTVNGGIDTSDTQTFTITVTSVNDAPSFMANDPVTVLEDAGLQTTSNWASFDPGPDNEAGQSVLAYQVSDISDPSLFSVAPSVTTDGTLTYTPADDANGTATFDVAVQDNGGSTNGGQDMSEAQTFTITIGSVNDAPTFTATDPAPVLVGSGAQVIQNWATFDPGPADESGQSVLSYVVSNDSNPVLFEELPSVDQDGVLRFTPSATLTGASTFEIQVEDDGGTANNGEDTSAIQTFTITVVDESLFSDGFETSFVTKSFEARTATLSKSVIEARARGSSYPTLVMRADDTFHSAYLEAYGRLSANGLQIQLVRFEYGVLTVGEWQTLYDDTAVLQW